MKAIRLLATLFAIPALAMGQKAVDPVNTNSKGLALKGYDTVAYFTAGEPTVGIEQHEHDWQGAKWRFSSEANLEKFKADPGKYAPQYGGYCAYAVSKGKTAGISPKAWTIVDDKLYVNHPWAKGKFKRDVEGNIAKADANWPNIPKNALR